MPVYAFPGQEGALLKFKPRYDHYIGGAWVPPTSGVYFDVVSPTNGAVFTQAARGDAADIDLALDAAHLAAEKWGKTSATERANILLKMADVMTANTELLAWVETTDNGKVRRGVRGEEGGGRLTLGRCA